MVIKPMEQTSKKQIGHTTLTYRVRLYDRHFDRLKETKELYDRVVKHFFDVLVKEEELLVQSDFLLLRVLEAKCIGTKEMKAAGVKTPYPLEGFPKVPLYFRRSAINTAIDLARKKAETLNPNMVLYKGMYRNFTDKTIDIKLLCGSKWEWFIYPFSGREFPEGAVRLSPMLVLNKKTAWLEVPLSFEVEDVRTVKERMKTEECICAMAFPDNDTLAVAVLLDRNGKELEHKFFRGGKAKEEQRRKVLEKIRLSEKSRGVEAGKQAGKMPENSSLYAEVKDINRHYAHSISRQIINYCLRQNIKVIVVPNYEKSIDFADKRYLKTDAYRWLGRSIIKNLKYKAFGAGIVVTSVKPYHMADCCSECGEKIRRYNRGHSAGKNYYGGKLFTCPNGHSGNAAENTARNIGKSFLTYFPTEEKLEEQQKES